MQDICTINIDYQKRVSSRSTIKNINQRPLTIQESIAGLQLDGFGFSTNYSFVKVDSHKMQWSAFSAVGCVNAEIGNFQFPEKMQPSPVDACGKRTNLNEPLHTNIFMVGRIQSSQTRYQPYLQCRLFLVRLQVQLLTSLAVSNVPWHDQVDLLQHQEWAGPEAGHIVGGVGEEYTVG